MKFASAHGPLLVILLAQLSAAWNGAAQPTLSLVQNSNTASRGSSTSRSAVIPRYFLRAEKTWQLNLPRGERFDASGLALTPKGELLTVNDRAPSVYRIQFQENTNAANLVLLTNAFTSAQLAPFAREKIGRYDTEGVASDEDGRLYVCEESNRWILRYDPKENKVERLSIDWAPVRKYFDSTDLNASFEGVAVGGGRLYVANERKRCRIIVVDLGSLRVIDDFFARPSASKARDLDYSDLSWFDGALFVLLRESRCVLKIEPESHRVLAEYDFREMENDPEVLYFNRYPTGTMEGLAVARDFIWLATDNNGLGRVRYPRDVRPTLFKCRRPDRKSGAGVQQPTVSQGG